MKDSGQMVKINLLFIFIFLNIWDFALNRVLFNGMIIGAVMFLPAVFLWFVENLRAIALLTLISILEFTVILVFVLEGFELGGGETSVKSIFWIPYLIMAGTDGYFGLKNYWENKGKRGQALGDFGN